MKTKDRFYGPRRKDAGVVMILFTLSIFVLFAFMGLAMDASYLYFQKRRMQTAADAGAYGAALEKLRGNTDFAAAAKSDTSLNGFTDATNNVTVTVNNPPASGPKAGNAAFIEVIVQQPQDTWFMRVVNWNSAMVSARAVAGLGNTNNGCVYTLNTDTGNANNGFFVNGNTVSNFSCGVFSNANFRAVGGGCVVTDNVSYTGTYSNMNTDGNCGPTGVGRGVPIVDPLKNKFTTPSPTNCDQTNFKVTGGTNVVISPGVYCGGISITGSVNNVTFSPGDYVLMGGGMTIGGSTSVSGSGVTFWNTYPGSQMNKYNGVKITTSGTVALSAPTIGTNGTAASPCSAACRALLFYQDPRVNWAANNGSILTGSSTSVYDGIIYFPTTDLTYAGNSSASLNGTDGYTILVGYDITVAGTAHVNTDFSALDGGSNPLQDAVFAE